VMNRLLHNNRLTAVVVGGCFMLLAALLMQRVFDPGEEKMRAEQKPGPHKIAETTVA